MKYRYRVLGFLSFLSIITYVDRVCIAVAGKSIQEDLGLRPDQWGWVLGAFTISYGLFEVPTGAMGDRIGPRRVLTRIVVWWSGFTALTGACVSWSQLMIVRFLFGAGEAGAFPNMSACIARWFPTVERARALGFVWMATRVGGALTPILVIPIQQAYGWPASFYTFGVVGVVWTAAWYWWFRDRPRDQPNITAGELVEIGEAGAVPGVHVKAPWRRLLAQPNLWWIMLMYHTYCWSGFFYLSWLHVFLQNGRGFTKQDLVFMSWLPFVFGAIANLLGGFTSDLLVRRYGLKWGRRLVGAGGLGLSTLFIGATLFTDDKLLSVVFLALGYAGSDFMLPVAWAVCMDVGRRHVGAITGAMNMAGQIGSFLTVVTFGYIVNATGSYDAPLVPIVMMTAISALVWLKIDPTRPLLDLEGVASAAGPAPAT